MTVTVKADTRDVEEAVDRVTVALAELDYAMRTTQAAITRLSRVLWPTLPLWRRLWLTFWRKGW